MENKYIKVLGARENNLKNIDINIPRGKFVVMTGLSGSGKSSLAFDTIYAEGQRRYVESLSAYARQFLGNSEKPDVDSIEGLSPSISIDQKTTSKNPRSTVGTVTEIYDYLRLLYARVGTPTCPKHGIEITSQSAEQIADALIKLEEGTRLEILAPIVRGEKGTHERVLQSFIKDGFVRAKINGEIYDLEDAPKLEKNKKHTISIVIDRIKVKQESYSRIYDSVENTLKTTEGLLIAQYNGEEKLFSEHFSCNECGFTIPELEPRLFSFNSPFGACDTCNGLGIKKQIDVNKIIASQNLTIREGTIKSWDDEESFAYQELQNTCDFYKIDTRKPFKKLTDKEKEIIFYGSKDPIRTVHQSKNGKHKHDINRPFEGVINILNRRYIETTSNYMREYYNSLMVSSECDKCKGKRLNEAALCVKIGGISIAEFTNKSVKDALDFVENLELSDRQNKIATMILKEVRERLSFLKSVGLDYLSLDRSSGSLSGGEAQRIRLATQIGSRLSGVLYVLDEPSIGLHQRDNQKLIETLKSMRDLGNTLIVVEHDEETMMESDYLVDIGPGAGIHGGSVVAEGTPEEVMNNKNSLTGKYLSGEYKIDTPKKRRKLSKDVIKIIGAKENNLKNVTVEIPKGVMNVITGVSGSGKSTLINEVLFKAISERIYKRNEKAGKHKEIKGIDDIEKIIDINQSPIGRTPRSNPATYTGVFDHIRDLFTATNEAKRRGYKKGRFSFNVKGGRCDNCNGDGVTKIEMHFLPDVYVECEVCKGKRYNKETLEVKWQGKTISDVLKMTIDDALVFFESHHKIANKLQTLKDVGLGYITLGQRATTLSGGEAQRVKLASELHKKITNKTLYILDEPTTGLHVHDVKKLIDVINRIVDEKATVIIIEHNLDVIKVADNIIDIGPEGGDEGGNIVVTGTPEKVAEKENSYTGKFLKKVL